MLLSDDQDFVDVGKQLTIQSSVDRLQFKGICVNDRQLIDGRRLLSVSSRSFLMDMPVIARL